jgi:hypothetical protein
VRNVNKQIRPPGESSQIALFDSDGLPWSSRLAWGGLLLFFSIIGFVLAPVIGMYLGLWLRTKGWSAQVFILYLAITSLFVFLVSTPEGLLTAGAAGMLALCLLLLWIIAAFTLRHQTLDYYSAQESTPFRLNPVMTAIFGPWYVGGHLRADFPLDDAGKTGSGVLKLI